MGGAGGFFFEERGWFWALTTDSDWIRGVLDGLWGIGTFLPFDGLCLGLDSRSLHFFRDLWLRRGFSQPALCSLVAVPGGSGRRYDRWRL